MTTVLNGTEPGLQSGPFFNPSPNMPRNVCAIIMAAGSGSRLSEKTGGIPKQFLDYQGVPLYWHSVRNLARCPFINGLIFVFPEKYCECEDARIRDLQKIDDPGIPWKIVPGGVIRAESARNGVCSLPMECTEVFIHDAARPFISPELVQRLYGAFDPELGGVIPGIAVTDTIKEIDGQQLAINTPVRSSLRAIQTPQLFNVKILKKIYAKKDGLSENITDEAKLMEKAGYKIRVVEGDSHNIKITNPEDLELLASGTENMLPCVGFGYDVHRYGEGKPLKLGGVTIPTNLKIVAHSDGDVLLHALVDAILGCGALGDIGTYFPDTDPAWENTSSAIFLDHVLSLTGNEGIVLTHLDLTIVAQKPAISPWKKEIVKNIGRLCNLDVSQINIKATTEEGLGFTGHLEGIKAYAVASAVRKRR